MENLTKTTQYIVSRSNELKNKYTVAKDAPIEFACIFSQNEKEYSDLTSAITPIGKIVEDTKSGFTYLLNEPIETDAGRLRLLKIRKPDPERKERGDADFNTDYENFRQKYLNNPKFELVKRDTFEMLRLAEQDFDVMACFSNIPKSKDLRIVL